MSCPTHTATRGLASGGVRHKHPGPRLSPYGTGPCRTCRPGGATSAPTMLRDAARVLPGRRQKRRRDVWTARVMGRPPRGPLPPVERQRFRGHMGRVAHRWAIAKTLLWPIGKL